MVSGFETRANEHYYRDVHEEKLTEPWEKHIVFQYTLSGEGCFENGSGVHAMKPGSFFLMVVPSPHRYYLPDHGAAWTFAYMAISHPYVVERLEEAIAESSTVWAVDCRRNLVQSAFRLISMHHQRTLADEIAEEQALFSWMLEFVRYSRQNSHSFKPAELLLTEVRSQVLEALPQALDVPTLAAARGMARSNFSHFFRRLTGVSPGYFMREVRLQHAADLLRQSHHASIKNIAAQCGFPDVPAFAKLFRSRFHVTPGQFGRVSLR
jgi:AraC-like DNA-binding protein